MIKLAEIIQIRSILSLIVHRSRLIGIILANNHTLPFKEQKLNKQGNIHIEFTNYTQ